MNADDIKQIAVIGAGLMGHGIAQEFATAGYDVRLTSRTEESLGRGVDQIKRNLERLVGLGVLETGPAARAEERLTTCLTLEDAVSDADLVIEAVYEDLSLKRQVFEQLDRACPDRTLLASTTSTFPATQIATATGRPDRVLVAHYINPPYLVPLVELAPGEGTSEETLGAVHALLTGIGKQPVVLRKEVPGFISVRLQVALLREALSLVQSGVATPEDIDKVIRTSIGRRWAVAGVFEVLELAGWDVVSDIASWLFPQLESSLELPAVLRERVERDELGVKSGKGFYDWTADSAEDLRRRIAHALVEIDAWDR
jgi:3-hydroxybutyryl-CoA dehydrogenase